MLRALRKRGKGQSAIEYAALLTIVLGSFVAAGHYVKRGLQGRWKATADDLGDQYDPRIAGTSIRHTIVSNTDTKITMVNTIDGVFSMRRDLANSTERKQGTRTIGAF